MSSCGFTKLLKEDVHLMNIFLAILFFAVPHFFRAKSYFKYTIVKVCEGGEYMQKEIFVLHPSLITDLG
jgi:hypothetical protein